MAKQSIFEEIVNSNIYSESDIKRRADHIIKSAIHLLERIDKDYDDETAKRLEKRLLASIKNRKPSRFKIKVADVELGESNNEENDHD